MRRFRDKVLTTEYVWSDPFTLAACKDYEAGLHYEFIYDAEGALAVLRLRDLPARPGGRLPDGTPVACRPRSAAEILYPDMPKAGPDSALADLFGPGPSVRVLRCGHDQVGTPKLFVLETGAIVKRLDYDSFGKLLRDSHPDFFVPVGFAGGLADRDTGLVRFGWRDYDPAVGRFITPDPLGDTGGDHDLYDYCVDDPVSQRDPTGLIAPVALFALGKAAALALGIGGTMAAVGGAEGLNRAQTGEWSGNVVRSVGKVLPRVAGAWAASALPGAAVMAAPAVGAAAGAAGAAATNLMQRVGAEATARVPEAAANFIEGAARFGEGVVNSPISPVPPSIPQAIGTFTAEAYRKYKEYLHSKK